MWMTVAARYKSRVLLLLTVSSLFAFCGFGIMVGLSVCSISSGSCFLIMIVLLAVIKSVVSWCYRSGSLLLGTSWESYCSWRYRVCSWFVASGSRWDRECVLDHLVRRSVSISFLDVIELVVCCFTHSCDRNCTCPNTFVWGLHIDLYRPIWLM